MTTLAWVAGLLLGIAVLGQAWALYQAPAMGIMLAITGFCR